jgi:hypothetical protein
MMFKSFCLPGEIWGGAGVKKVGVCLEYFLMFALKSTAMVSACIGGERALARLCSPHINLNATLFEKEKLVPSPLSLVCQVPEDLYHYLMDCRKYAAQRGQLCMHLQSGVVPLLKLTCENSTNGREARVVLSHDVAEIMGHRFL